ncbi:uncharacterized protein KGF55_001875 [Candida pseudojiufengensis]|uniref:uncharacterized protein n=1 Tax=Candida pseudojiufengensis TaxID=497109 RepID=UPI00222434A6|nr:uncharacterized protein KGF55_001875 [Candida pseudojiufengensis]KAI5964805.1 hypothetical protein KGF55_001875 [Candida pseudojiufengensis]
MLIKGLGFSILSLAYLFATIDAHGDEAYEDTSDLKYFYACNAQVSAEGKYCSPKERNCLCFNDNAKASIAGCLHEIGKTEHKYTYGLIRQCHQYPNATVDKDWYSKYIQIYNEKAKYPPAKSSSGGMGGGGNGHGSTNQTSSQSQQSSTSSGQSNGGGHGGGHGGGKGGEGGPPRVVLDYPIILNKTNLTLYQESYARFYNNYNYSLYYGAGMYGYWLLIFLLGAVANWSKFLCPSLTKKMTNPIVNWWRKNISMPATFRKKKSQEQNFLKFFGFLIPSRFESLVIFLFYVLTLVVHAVNSTAIKDEILMGSKYKAEMRYVADRTGITATMIMPLIFLFAGRNNFLQWLVGWNYSTFMAYHRHTARIMFILVVIHAVNYTVLFVQNGRYSMSLSRPYFYWGIVATVCGGAIMIQGMLYLRRRWYELFLLFHILMAVFWVIGSWYHVIDFGFIWMVYPAVAVWCFDRAVRIGRLFTFGFPHADVTLLSDETLKVVVPKPSYWKSIPGGHAFIHFLKPTYFYQSHPFTFTDSVDQGNSIILYAKVKGGITHSLYQTLAKQPGRSCKIRVSVEGPYGESTAAKYADTAVFIAGGNGIPGIFSEAIDVAVNSKDGSNRVKLTWIVREWRSLYWFYEELLSLKNTKIETTIYVTQPNSHIFIDEFNNRFSGLERLSLDKPEDSDGLSLEKDDSVKERVNIEVENSSCDEKSASFNEKSDGNSIIATIKDELSHIEFKEGRPDIENIIDNDVQESNGSVAFVTCGHPMMVDDIRYCCTQNISNPGKKRVDFYEQIQVWA